MLTHRSVPIASNVVAATTHGDVEQTNKHTAVNMYPSPHLHNQYQQPVQVHNQKHKLQVQLQHQLPQLYLSQDIYPSSNVYVNSKDSNIQLHQHQQQQFVPGSSPQLPYAFADIHQNKQLQLCISHTFEPTPDSTPASGPIEARGISHLIASSPTRFAECAGNSGTMQINANNDALVDTLRAAKKPTQCSRELPQMQFFDSSFSPCLVRELSSQPNQLPHQSYYQQSQPMICSQYSAGPNISAYSPAPSRVQPLFHLGTRDGFPYQGCVLPQHPPVHMTPHLDQSTPINFQSLLPPMLLQRQSSCFVAPHQNAVSTGYTYSHHDKDTFNPISLNTSSAPCMSLLSPSTTNINPNVGLNLRQSESYNQNIGIYTAYPSTDGNTQKSCIPENQPFPSARFNSSIANTERRSFQLADYPPNHSIAQPHTDFNSNSISSHKPHRATTKAHKPSTKSNDIPLSNSTALNAGELVDKSVRYNGHLGLNSHLPKKKRDQVKTACINCRKACKKCSHERPCCRCVTHGIESSCIDVPRRDRTKTLKRDTSRVNWERGAMGVTHLSAHSQPDLSYDRADTPLLSLLETVDPFSPGEHHYKGLELDGNIYKKASSTPQPLLDYSFSTQMSGHLTVYPNDPSGSTDTMQYQLSQEAMLLSASKKLADSIPADIAVSTPTGVNSGKLCFSFMNVPSLVGSMDSTPTSIVSGSTKVNVDTKLNVAVPQKGAYTDSPIFFSKDVSVIESTKGGSAGDSVLSSIDSLFPPIPCLLPAALQDHPHMLPPGMSMSRDALDYSYKSLHNSHLEPSVYLNSEDNSVPIDSSRVPLELAGDVSNDYVGVTDWSVGVIPHQPFFENQHSNSKKDRLCIPAPSLVNGSPNVPVSGNSIPAVEALPLQLNPLGAAFECLSPITSPHLTQSPAHGLKGSCDDSIVSTSTPIEHTLLYEARQHLSPHINDLPL
ncbi:hypothetical protein BASA62_007231 [Batrachochytrium salamandrivorans]|nr:hypothetical protein BASA62_007231 [Batrachochytrium salamandrivorans]